MAASGKYFDPFATRGPVRYTGDNGTPTDAEPLNPPKFIRAPTLDGETFKGFTFFYSHASADLIMDRIHNACNQLCGQIKSKGPYHMRAVLPLEVNKVSSSSVQAVPVHCGFFCVVVEVLMSLFALTGGDGYHSPEYA